ncbi:c-type cytochrome [Frigidibacter sp. MR17.24]|uniref:c-type cytochrome n=1 Tax=Frigidibacter sp. MR17.24 TaxID=3127345 RepID=UPI003012B85F
MMTPLRTLVATLAALAVLGGLGGAATVAFGLFDTSARNGHWAVTDWAMHTTFERRVARLAPPDRAVPDDLDDPALIELGARHYDSACAMCHATPGADAGATIAAMVPHPPQLETAVAPWTEAEMHWIVAEGVKMTGMPAWPAAGRGDEVWAVVAFLRAVQQGMDGAEYARITAPAPEGYCAGCHGPAGTERAPRLDILQPGYIAEALAAYREGRRPSGIMAHAATKADPARDAALARDLARLPGPPAQPVRAQTEAGAALAARGSRAVPACLSCHGAQDNPMMPSIDGQGRAYIAAQLRLWRDGARGGAERAPLMAAAARDLDDGEIAALAAYFAARPAPDAR